VAAKAGAGAFGTDDVVVTGEITLNSNKSFNVVDATAGATGFFVTATTGDSAQLQKVSDLDVSNVDSANRSLAIVDSAIAAVSAQRASFGALQSRFDNAISNLQTNSNNLSASRSRIQDADFASETANLSRSQILQQAGTAMVAQANQLPQGVLALLR
jgi:flagellin